VNVRALPLGLALSMIAACNCGPEPAPDGGTAGGSTAGGSTAGGSTAGGSTAGGSTAGGSTAGGSTAGGSTAGGSTAGGSTAGGSTAGGSTAGGSTAGGSTAGGSTAGGSTAGGSTAGGAATDAGPNIAFVTERTFTGALGGRDGGDAICMQDALDAGLPPNLYVAWLSTSTGAVVDRFGAARGWVRPDGKPVFDTLVDAISGRIQYPLSLTARGDDLGGRFVYTGAQADGGTSSFDCNGWTDGTNGRNAWSGSSHSSGGAFTAHTVDDCTNPQPIYCLGSQNVSSARAPQMPVRRAFVTPTRFLANGGLSGADALCAASKGTLPGTFRALLATTSASAASRFDGGLPWARVDDVPLTDAAGDMFTSPWNTGMSLDSSGVAVPPGTRVWVGATGFTALGTVSTTCNNWSALMGFGFSRDAHARITITAGSSCGASGVHLICLEE